MYGYLSLRVLIIIEYRLARYVCIDLEYLAASHQPRPFMMS